MKPSRLATRRDDFLDAFVRGTKAAKRRARQRLKRYLGNPTIPNAMAYDAAAEAHQLAASREDAARKLKESWSQ